MSGFGPGIIYGGGGATGTVTEISVGTGLVCSPGIITTTGEISFAPIGNLELLANISGSTNAALPTSISSYLDAAITNVQGSIFFRSSGSWVELAPGTLGEVLTSGGASADISWAPGGGSSSVSIAPGTGITVTPNPIVGSGTIALSAITSHTLLSNITGSSAIPTANSLSSILDTVLGAAEGNLAVRGASTWTVIGPGTSGFFLTSGGSSAVPGWSNALPEGTKTEALNVYNYQDWFNNASSGGSGQASNAWTNLLAANNAAGFSGQIWFQAQALTVTQPGGGWFVASGTRITGIGNGNNSSNALIPNSFIETSVNDVLFECGGVHDPGGRIFEHLGFKYTGSGTSAIAIDCAQGGGSTNVVADTCSFYNWPCAFFAANQDVSCGLIRSEINVDHNAAWGNTNMPQLPSQVNMINFGGPQQFCIGPIEHLQQPYTNSPPGPTGLTWLNVAGPAEHATVRDMHVSDFQWGISFAGTATARFCFFENNEIAIGGTAIYAGLNTPQSGSAPNITGMKFFGNHLRIDGGYVAGNTTPIVYVDTAGANNVSVNDFDFIGNSVYSGGQHGYQFNQGSGMRIIGGCSSGNNPSGGAGVNISGPMGDLIALGTNLTPSYSFFHPSPPQQEWAVLVNGTNVVGPCQFAFDNMQGYGTGLFTDAVSITGTLASADAIQFVECLGYNDTLPSLTTSLPTSGTVHSDAAANHGYHGPSVLYISGGSITGITIGKFISSGSSLSSTPTPLALPFPVAQTAGLITVPLRPGFGYSITYTGTPTLLLVGV
jgi:hypothetical protein